MELQLDPLTSLVVDVNKLCILLIEAACSNVSKGIGCIKRCKARDAMAKSTAVECYIIINRGVEKSSCKDDIADLTAVKELDVLTAKANAISDNEECADFYLDSVIPKMKELRKICDEAETLTAKSYWPFPTYGDILFSVR